MSPFKMDDELDDSMENLDITLDVPMDDSNMVNFILDEEIDGNTSRTDESTQPSGLASLECSGHACATFDCAEVTQVGSSQTTTFTTKEVHENLGVCFGLVKNEGNKMWRKEVESFSNNANPIWSDEIAVQVQERLVQKGVSGFFVDANKQETCGKKRKCLAADGTESIVKVDRKVSGIWREATREEIQERTKERFKENLKERFKGKPKRRLGRPPNSATRRDSSPPIPQQTQSLLRNCLPWIPTQSQSLLRERSSYPISAKSVCFEMNRHPGTVKWLERVKAYSNDVQTWPQWKDSIAVQIQAQLAEESYHDYFILRDDQGRHCTSIQDGVWSMALDNEIKEKTELQFLRNRQLRQAPFGLRSKQSYDGNGPHGDPRSPNDDANDDGAFSRESYGGAGGSQSNPSLGGCSSFGAQGHGMRTCATVDGTSQCTSSAEDLNCCKSLDDEERVASRYGNDHKAGKLQEVNQVGKQKPPKHSIRDVNSEVSVSRHGEALHFVEVHASEDMEDDDDEDEDGNGHEAGDIYKDDNDDATKPENSRITVVRRRNSLSAPRDCDVSSLSGSGLSFLDNISELVDRSPKQLKTIRDVCYEPRPAPPRHDDRFCDEAKESLEPDEHAYPLAHNDAGNDETFYYNERRIVNKFSRIRITLGRKIGKALSRRSPGQHSEDGLRHFDRGQYKKAETSLKRAAAMQERDSPNSLDLATIYYNLGKTLDNQNELQEAQRYFEMASSIQKEHMPDSIDLANTYGNLGCVFEKEHQLNKARRCYEHALTIYYNQNSMHQALSYHEKALSIRRRQAKKNFSRQATGMAIDRSTWTSAPMVLMIHYEQGPEGSQIASR